MLLTIDIGNTDTELGLFDWKNSGILVVSSRIRTQEFKNLDETGMVITNFLECQGFEESDIKALICSSVVPSLDGIIQEVGEKYLDCHTLLVSIKLKTGLKFCYPNPYELGADRIVNATGARQMYGRARNLILIDFGTATTFCVVSNRGEYLGGIIMPGIATSMEALFEKAEKLHPVELRRPASILGKSTADAICSGIYYGTIKSIEGLVQQLKNDLDFKTVKVIATGGFCKLIASGTKCIDIVEPKLTLKGLEILFRKNLERFV